MLQVLVDEHISRTLHLRSVVVVLMERSCFDVFIVKSNLTFSRKDKQHKTVRQDRPESERNTSTCVGLWVEKCVGGGLGFFSSACRSVSDHTLLIFSYVSNCKQHPDPPVLHHCVTVI